MARGIRCLIFIAPLIALSCGQGSKDKAEMIPVATSTVAGTVVDSKGKPVAGATVVLIPATSPATTNQADGKGRFEIVIGGDSYKIEIKDGDTVISTSSFTSQGDAPVDLGKLKPDGLYYSAGAFWYKDSDNDGYSDGTKTRSKIQPADHKLPGNLTSLKGDCNDGDRTIHPGAKEKAGDGIDQNCDGADKTPTEPKKIAYYRDSDKDGYGDKSKSKLSLSKPDGYIAKAGDCNDNDSSIHPKAKEVLNDGIDQDCDGVDSEGKAFYKDSDKDGYGDKNTRKFALAKPDGFVADNADCDDGNAAVHPEAEEILRDGIDQNCDGRDEEGVAFYKDLDGDGFGDASAVQFALERPEGFVADSSDCNDGDASVNPSAKEILSDGIDQNCDDADAEGSAFYQDSDGDGFGDPATSRLALEQPAGFVADNSDCRDDDATVNPGAKEVLSDGIDQDCDGVDPKGAAFYKDGDGDGFGDSGSMQLALTAPNGFVDNSSDCDDGNASVHPGAEEIVGDEIDQNCDGEKPQGKPSLFADDNLKGCVAKMLAIEQDQKIDAESLSGIDILDCKNSSISNLGGIERLENLEWVFFQGNQIEDLSPMASLAKLERIYLQENKIINIAPLANLNNLELLSLRGNKVSDISPLSGLKKLATLDLWGNNVTDISALASLTALKELDLWENSISDITPLKELYSLEMLTLGGNKISDLSPLAGLGNLKLLSIRKNQISDISSLAGMNKLNSVYLGENCITDFTPVAKLQQDSIYGKEGQRDSCKIQASPASPAP